MKGFLRPLADFMSECISLSLSLFLSVTTTGDWSVPAQVPANYKEERKEWPGLFQEYFISHLRVTVSQRSEKLRHLPPTPVKSQDIWEKC